MPSTSIGSDLKQRQHKATNKNITKRCWNRSTRSRSPSPEISIRKTAVRPVLAPQRGVQSENLADHKTMPICMYMCMYLSLSLYDIYIYIYISLYIYIYNKHNSLSLSLYTLSLSIYIYIYICISAYVPLPAQVTGHRHNQELWDDQHPRSPMADAAIGATEIRALGDRA